MTDRFTANEQKALDFVNGMLGDMPIFFDEIFPDKETLKGWLSLFGEEMEDD